MRGFRRFVIFWFVCFQFLLVSSLFAQIASDSLSESEPSMIYSVSESLTSPVLSSSINMLGSTQSYLMYDPLDGSTQGSQNFSGYFDGILNQAAVFNGAQNYLQYSSDTQIPRSGAIQFYLFTPGFYPAINGDIIFTQAGYGGASRGDIHLLLLPTNRLWFGQWPARTGDYWNRLESPLPFFQWVKITVVYGTFGMYLYVDDQLAASDLTRQIPMSLRPFYFGTRRFYGTETAFTGLLDEIITFTEPQVKIITPVSGTIFTTTGDREFVGTGIGLTWYHQGVPIGSGNIAKINLSPGEHEITLSGQDFIGQPNSHTITVSVESNLEIDSVVATPTALWLDDSGAGSGVVFRATTTDTGTVNFKVQTPSGTVISLGSSSAVQQGDEYVAKLSWWGQAGLEEGIYTIIAEAGTTSKSSTFEVKHTTVSLIGLGKWMKNTKDPAAILPSFAAAEVCPLEPWETMLSLPDGYFSSIAVGDPVNTSSGNLSVPEVDFTIKDRRSFAVARIYNSLEPEIGSFGRGWSSPLLVNLEITDDYVVFTNSDGSRLLFNRTGASFASAAPTDLKLEYNADTEFYTLSHPTGATWIFNSNGQIIQMLRSCCGQGASDAIVFSYDAAGKLAQVNTPSGKSISFTFDADDLITVITDSTGRTHTYTYDDDKNLISVTDPLNRETTYSYDEAGFMTSYTKPGNKTTVITYFEHRVASIKDPTGAQSTFAWDFDNRKLVLTDFAGIVHEYAFDAEWRMISYSVPSANLSKEFSAAAGRVAAIKDSLNYSDHYSYDENSSYKSHTDKLGNVTTFTWHPTLKKLTGKTDALGRTWSYEWCSRGNLIKETDPAGHEVTYTYDSHNNRTSKTDALGHITRYVYDTTGNYLIQTIDAMGGVSSFTYDVRGNLTASTDQLGRTTSYEYDLIDRLIKSTYPDGRFTAITYDAAGNIASRIDNLGRVTAYTYDANGKLLTTTRPDNTVLAHAYDAAGRRISSTDALGRITAYEYNALDNMVKVTYPDQTYQTYVYDTEKRLISSSDELGNATTYEYDPMGRMFATVDPAGSRNESQYDAVGRKVAAKDPLGRITAYEYDVLDRVVKTTAPDLTTNTASYDAVGNLLVSTNALNQQTVYEYDALNRQIKTTQPNGAQFSTVYDAVGQVISKTDALGNSTVNAYDNAGRRISTTNALNHVWQYVYDAAGRLVRTVDPMNGVATMTYDVMDRVVTESDAIGRLTAYEYDASGKRIAKTDAMGRRSLYGYDTRDRLTAEVDAEGRMVSHGYDAAGHKISLTDGAGRVWRWVYDSLGRVTAEIDPLGNQVLNSYNAVGSLVFKTNARAQATGYEYDLMNRLVKINYPDSTEATFSYDALGRELVRSGIAGTVAKTYDMVGNLLSETFVNQNKGWSYSYDLMGNRIQAISPENETFTYRYDNLYRLSELNTGKSSEMITYAYDALGRNIEEKRVDSTTANTFDAAGQLLVMKHYSNADTSKVLALRQYSYDPAGNRISMADEAGNNTVYSYDDSNWLTRVVYPNADVVAYTYNGAGDRLTEQHNQDVAVTYSYDAAGRMTGKGDEAFEYDADGNMLSDNTSFYTWNSDNRLIQVEKTLEGCRHDKYQGYGYGHLKHGRTIVAYENYDYLPNDWRRVARKLTRYVPQNNGKGNDNTTTEQSTFYSVYDGNDESHEYLLSEVAANKNKPAHNELKLVREFVNGPGTDDIKYTRYGVTSLAMLKDGLGSIIALTGAEAQIVAQIGYNAWGEFMWSGNDEGAPCSVDQLGAYLERIQNTRNFGKTAHNGWNFGRHFASELSPYLYTARRYSDFTGQYYNRHRFYSPALGRFVSKDPISFRGGHNLWRYADNNPMRWVDPLGLFDVLLYDDSFNEAAMLAQKTIETGTLNDPLIIPGSSLSSITALKDSLKAASQSKVAQIDRFIFSGHGLLPENYPTLEPLMINPSLFLDPCYFGSIIF
ncbi:MAG: hypothetical protein CVV64_19660 [Candidatus Wallbacteria bacterium HGW-Wallbacteria-1]|jgi:RHS repeat-associated protein|uniref:LamG-like jellyroll fold domain-containing protein n=1 Tax=Candidatus Wallbacteria bacterium HGW-Wallbacteria-1 TaxID=2013854 RepID=A0A2N1PIP4_9BACT|nr:MAG: hypothetical protein CVV64_19660 [Candidatus Wallbacteria bacterium HGW-Wallbacteria-1]